MNKMDKMNQDYDSYTMSSLDHIRIKPLLEQIRLNDLTFKFFISGTYWTSTSYDSVQKHNRELRRTIRTFFKDDIRMIFFIEKCREHNGYHRHILLEDASETRWINPTDRMLKFLTEDSEGSSEWVSGSIPSDERKMTLLKKVIGLLPFIPNGKSGLDIRPIHNLEKLTSYCTKQFEFVKPAYEVIDPASSDIDISYFLNHKQDGINWKTRYEAIPPRTHQSLSTTS